MTQEEDQALRTARMMIELGHPLETVLENPLIPAHLREFVGGVIRSEENLILRPTNVISTSESDWLADLDRSSWHYWLTLRRYLMTRKGWARATIRSLDNSSDDVLREIAPPSQEQFDIRGLVLGYVQSGKTANFTALAAKAADAGYRLIIVLSGIDKGLRKQTNLRLKNELVGYDDNRQTAVPFPPLGKQWHEYTSTDLDGDFQPGNASHGALQGTQPVLMVVKKNGDVLRRLLAWLDQAPVEARRTLPFLLIDDEADQASIDTRGSYQQEEATEDYELPSVINGLIRELLTKFDKTAYVAYTATPFANILIPHDTSDPLVGNDLYPKDFIVTLPKPEGYFGAEEFFGITDELSDLDSQGLDVLRYADESDIEELHQDNVPETLEEAILSFILSGASRSQRGDDSKPSTMLIHISHFIVVHNLIRICVTNRFEELRDEWRYQRGHGIRTRLQDLWERDFIPTTSQISPEKVVDFETIESHIGPFFESVQIRELNSSTGEALDYDREPSLKAIAIGGNKLSRGLTLEGLTVSYFVRRSPTYDTLMQMGRWFGFRGGYQDLTRLYTTDLLAGWFHDLAFIEHRLRQDMQTYRDHPVTPYEIGMRIWQHPSMQVTSPLKRRHASETTISQSFSLSLEQTFKFPLDNLEELATHAETNLQSVRQMARELGDIDTEHSRSQGPVWTNVDPELIVNFLQGFRVGTGDSRCISLPLICQYIQSQNDVGELTEWTVAICGRGVADDELGTVDWEFPTGPVSQISRSRVGETNSVGVITGTGDEEIGLTIVQKQQVDSIIEAARAAQETISRNRAAREVRTSSNGLLMLFPISRHSRPDPNRRGNRRAIFEDVNDPLVRDLIGLAISFPRSESPQVVDASFMQGTVEWRPIE